MKQPIDSSSFSDLVRDSLDTAMSSILMGESCELSVSEMYTCEGADLSETYDGQAVILGQDSDSGLTVGALFPTKIVTGMADVMMMGDGAGTDAITDENKDGIQEFSNQLLSSIQVPVSDKFRYKLSLQINSVDTFADSSVITPAKVMCTNFSGTYKGEAFTFTLFLDNDLYDKINSSSGTSAMASASGDQGGGGGVDTSSVRNLDMLLDIDIPVSIRMGASKLFLKDILGLGPGNIIELEQNANDPIELTINNKVIAQGEVVIVDGYFGFRIKNITSRADRLRKLNDES